MRHVAEHRAGLVFLPRFSAWVWGAVEFFALARSRWSLRARSARRA